MPDELVVCFTLNRQSIFGAAAAAKSADIQRRRADGTQALRIWPVPMRVELYEKDRLENARLVAREQFASFLWHIPITARPEYWGQAEVLYFPYYAYEEVLATIADAPRNTASLLSSIERLAGHLTRRPILMPPLLPDVRAQLLARYRPTTPEPSLPDPKRPRRFYISHAVADKAEDVVQRLAKTIKLRFGTESVFWDDMVPLGASWEPSLQREFNRSDALIVVAGPSWGTSEWTRREMDWALAAQKPVIPMLIQNVSWSQLPPQLHGLRGYKFDDANVEQSLGEFVARLSDIPAETSLESSPIADIDDPQRGRWGGLSERNGRRLSANVLASNNGWFQILFEVASIDGNPLEGDVEFHLHPSFHPSVMHIPTSIDGAHFKLHAWGAFTVGVSADAGRTLLELNLAELSDAPAEFKAR